MMLDHIGEIDKAENIRSAIAKVIEEGKVKTYDMGGTSTSLDVAEEVARNL